MICHHICICNTCMIFWRAWKYMNFISQWDKILQNSCSNESIREWISKENSWFHVEFWFQWMLALGYSPLPNGEAQQDVSKEGTTPLGIIIHALALAPPTYNDGNPTVKVAPSQRGLLSPAPKSPSPFWNWTRHHHHLSQRAARPRHRSPLPTSALPLSPTSRAGPNTAGAAYRSLPPRCHHCQRCPTLLGSHLASHRLMTAWSKGCQSASSGYPLHRWLWIWETSNWI